MRALRMIPATQITFRGLRPSEELKREIRDRITWLEEFCPPLLACRVRLQVPHRHHRRGRHVHVNIEMTVPRHPALAIAYESSLPDARVAIAEAFDVARRQLLDFSAGNLARR